jgi:nucleotide-binding universal stress UspA family protein
VGPLDGSKLAEEALPYAETLASRLDLRVTLLRVVPFPFMAYSGYEGFSYSYVPPYEKGITEHEETMAREYLERIRGQLGYPGKPVEALVITGHPASQIIDLAQTTAGSLVVMSTHGRSGVGRWVMGSVADRVLRASRRPVLVVRPQAARLPAAEAEGAQTRQRV